jgi:zinc protease
MRRIVSALTVLIFATTLHAQTAASTTKAPWEKIVIPPLPAFHPAQPKRIQLDNGVVIFLQEDHELPFIAGSINIRGGSRDEAADKVGLVSLYGDAWRTSGSVTTSGDKMDDLLEARAASVESSSDIDSTGISWNSLTGDFDMVFAQAVDLLEHPDFKAEKLKLAQREMLTGIVRRNDEASDIAAREASKLVYGADNPYGREPEIATVQNVTLDDLKAWHDRTMVPGNLLIAVEGDFDSAAMEAKLRAVFGAMKAGPVTPPLKTEFPGPKPGVYFIPKEDVDQSNIYIVGLGTERSNPDYYALAVMNEIFSGGFSSRLFQDVRTKQGLAYEVTGRYGAAYDHPGEFYVIAGTKSATTEKTVAAMLHEVELLKTQPPSDKEMREAKDQLLNSFIFNYDSPDKVMREQVNLEFYGYPLDLLSQYQSGIEKVTIADVSRVAKQYIDTSKLAIVVVGNPDEMETPLTELKLGPVMPIDITIPGMDALQRPQR